MVDGKGQARFEFKDMPIGVQLGLLEKNKPVKIQMVTGKHNEGVFVSYENGILKLQLTGGGTLEVSVSDITKVELLTHAEINPKP
ncbi:hypothetical protein [Pseudomonas baetica]|uniref:hypothetical protein n=1 Tax=Pseudomonas baetica TaxID=674054 RepID=UPI0028716FD3|nr:hypothetical protein [Pseudomonas baetica]MDR9860919.1 hypothetical protein [Pseudomonas baetica]